jgi:hypothetical protein
MLIGLQDRSPQKRKECSHCFRTSVTMCMRNIIAIKYRHTASSLCNNVQRNTRVFHRGANFAGYRIAYIVRSAHFCTLLRSRENCYDISGHYCMTITIQIKDDRHVECLFDSVAYVTCTRSIWPYYACIGTVYYSCPRPCFTYSAVARSVCLYLLCWLTVHPH